MVFLAPAVIIYSLFLIYPLVGSLGLSFFDDAPEGGRMFVGFDNIRRLLTDDRWAPGFWNAVGNNVLFFVVHFVVQNPIGLLLATLLTAGRMRGRGVYRTVLFMPTMLSVVIVGFIWQLILSPLWGVAEGFLTAVGRGELFQPWLGLQDTALVTLSLISVWQFYGIPMMLFYAALIGIPRELTESAYVDGAGSWNVFWRIKFPLILPVLGVVTVLTFVGNFNAFDLIYTTQGVLAGPDFSTDILGTYFFRTFFGQQLQLGNPTMGATVATMMFVIILLGVLAYMFTWRRKVQTYEL
ncbi:MAG: sugar ABC transporter permease [Spirochaetales bacterium]|nr:sugar ABC transporter permease [Spirochaetales bacterium]